MCNRFPLFARGKLDLGSLLDQLRNRALLLDDCGIHSGRSLDECEHVFQQCGCANISPPVLLAGHIVEKSAPTGDVGLMLKHFTSSFSSLPAELLTNFGEPQEFYQRFCQCMRVVDRDE